MVVAIWSDTSAVLGGPRGAVIGFVELVGEDSGDFDGLTLNWKTWEL